MAKTRTRKRASGKRAPSPRGIDTVPLPDKPVPKKRTKNAKRKVKTKRATTRARSKTPTNLYAIDTVPLPENVVAELKARRGELVRQLAKVMTEYPLVALAYYVNVATARALRANIAAASAQVSTMDGHFALEAAIETKLELRERVRKLERCLGRARTGADVAGCLKRFEKS